MLSKYSVKRPYTILVGVILILVLGYVSFTSMQTDLLPDMTLPYAVVYTTYPGASPEEVETIVTRPVEQSMATISNIETINSVSSENLSVVILEFAQSANMDAVTIEMRESLDQIEGYWDDTIGSPIIMKLNPDMLPVMVAALEAGDLSQSELTDLVNNEILPELESIEGVASVSASGLIEEDVQVVLREDKIRAVNRKVRDALDGKFAEAESEIEENQQKLEEGREKLESGQSDLAGMTSQAESQINAGSAQMITGQVQLQQKLAEVEQGLAKMDASAAELDAKEQELLEGEQALAALPDQKTALLEQQKQLDAAIVQLEAAPQQLVLLNLYLAGLDTEIQILQEQIALLEGGEVPKQTEAGEQTKAGQQTEAGQQPITGLQTGSEAAAAETAAGPMEHAVPKTQSAGNEVRSEDTQTELLAEILPGDGTETGGASGGSGSETSGGAASGNGSSAGSRDDAVIIEDITNIPDFSDLPSIDEIENLLPDIGAGGDQSGTLEQLKTQLAQKQAEREKYQNAKTQAMTALAAAGVNTTGDDAAIISSIDSAKSELVTRRVQLTDGIASLDLAIAQSPQQQEQIALGKLAIADGRKQLASGKAQLLSAKTQLLTAQQQIATGQLSMSSALAQLNSAKISATIEMAVGKAELNEGQKQLDLALEQIRDQKELAYDQADVTEIITPDLIKGLLAAQNFSMPAGYVTEDGVDFLVRVGNKFDETEDLEQLELLDLHLDGLDPIRLSDVADVVVTDNSGEVYAKINGNAGVMFSMQKQSGYSTGIVSNRIKEKFAQLEERDGAMKFLCMMDQGIYIDLVVDSVIGNMLSGAVLAVLILLVFLRSAKPTLVIACSIPISIMAAIVMMYFSGITLNIISLSGLALGIGMLVDNSIVVIENIYRLRGEGRPVKEAAVEGAREVAGAIAASTLTTVCVFLPIVFTDGITRQLFVDMGLTIAYSLLASLVVALTLVPAMGAGLLRRVNEKPSGVITAMQNGYAKLLGWSLHVKLLVLLLSVAMLILSAYLAVSRGTAFMPEMESTQVSVSLEMPKDSTFEETAEMSDLVMDRIAGVQDVTDVGSMIGGGGMMSMMGGGGSDAVSMYVLLDENRTLSNEELTQKIYEQTQDLNCELTVETSTMDMSALGGSGISIHIQGRDLDRLKQMAGEVAARIESVEGTQNVFDGIAEKTLELRLVVDKNKAMSYQLTTAQIFQFLQGKLAEAKSATTLNTLSKDYSVLVVSDTDETLTRDKIKKLKIKGKDEENKEIEIPLSELVEFQDTEGFSSINREAQRRYVNVTAELEDGYNIGLVAAEVEKALADYEVPDGYSLQMKGEDETINEAMSQVVKMLLLAVLFMYLIMVAQFQSLKSPFIIIFTIPLAFTGGFFGLYLTDHPVSVIAMIGFVMLSGIIVNNGIVLVDYINQLREGGMEKRAAIVEAGRSRLRPILMTALTTILGLMTMAMGRGMGADMVQPMAIVTIGGLTYGTLLTLFVIPCIYDVLNRKEQQQNVKSD